MPSPLTRAARGIGVWVGGKGVNVEVDEGIWVEVGGTAVEVGGRLVSVFLPQPPNPRQIIATTYITIYTAFIFLVIILIIHASDLK